MLHLPATAREFGIKLSIDDFDRLSKKTPVLADLKPWGNYTAPEMYDAGGMPVVAKRLLEAGLLHANEKTVTGRTIGQEAQAAPETPGQYLLKFDLVSEGIDWFERCGSPTTIKPLWVRP